MFSWLFLDLLHFRCCFISFDLVLIHLFLMYFFYLSIQFNWLLTLPLLLCWWTYASGSQRYSVISQSAKHKLKHFHTHSLHDCCIVPRPAMTCSRETIKGKKKTVHSSSWAEMDETQLGPRDSESNLLSKHCVFAGLVSDSGCAATCWRANGGICSKECLPNSTGFPSFPRLIWEATRKTANIKGSSRCWRRCAEGPHAKQAAIQMSS